MYTRKKLNQKEETTAALNIAVNKITFVKKHICYRIKITNLKIKQNLQDVGDNEI